MKKRNAIYYVAIILLIILYYIAEATGYLALAFLPIGFYACWIISKLLADKQELN